MKSRRRRSIAILSILSLYAAGIVWAYFRLPWAVVDSLPGRSKFELAQAVSPAQLVISPAQLWYLRRALPVPIVPFTPHRTSTDPYVPRMAMSVTWNALVLARVRSAIFLHGKTGMYGSDSIYLCLFGAWVPVFTFVEASGWPPPPNFGPGEYRNPEDDPLWYLPQCCAAESNRRARTAQPPLPRTPHRRSDLPGIIAQLGGAGSAEFGR